MEEIRTEILPIFLSVVIPVYNSEKEIPNLLDRMTELLSRLVSDYEIIIIDNASTDDSVS